MAIGTPIILTLYGPNDEVVSTHSRAIITTRFLERAIELSETMMEMGQSREVLVALDQLLVDFFSGQFTLDQIADGGDFSEKMAVLNAILSKAGAVFGPTPANPTKPGMKPRLPKAR